jgi:hypothetical protein
VRRPDLFCSDRCCDFHIAYARWHRADRMLLDIPAETLRIVRQIQKVTDD